MATSYFTMVWVIFALTFITVLISAIFAYTYFKRNGRLKRDIDKVAKDIRDLKDTDIKDLYKKIEYMHELFENHFKVTDQTIVDLRKERDELKEEIKAYKEGHN